MKLSQRLRQLRDPAELYWWLLKFNRRTSRRLFWRSALFYLTASVLEIVSLGALILAVRAIDPDQSTGYNVLDRAIGEGDFALFLVAGFLFCAQAGTALMVYLSVREVRRLGRAVNHGMAQQLIDFVADEHHGLRGVASRVDRNELLQSIGSDAKMAGLATLTYYSLAKALTLSLVYSWALVQIAPTATLALIPIVLIAVPISLRMAHRVQGSSRSFFMSSSQAYGIEVRDAVTKANDLEPLDSQEPEQERRSTLEGPVVDEFYDQYDMVLLANDQTSFATTTLQALAMAVALGVLGRSALAGTIAFGTVLVYVLSVGRAAANARTLGSHLTNLVRYHPTCRRIYEILTAQDPFGPDGERPPTVAPITEGSLLATTSALGRMEIARISVAMAKAGVDFDPTAMMIVPGVLTLSSHTLEQLVFPNGSPADTPPFAELMPTKRIKDIAKRTEIHWEMSIENDDWNDLAQVLKVAALFLRAQHTGQDVLLSVGHTEGLDDLSWNELAPLRASFRYFGITEGRPIKSERFPIVYEETPDCNYIAMPFEEWKAAKAASGGVDGAAESVLVDFL
jgi:ABC-type multidrug transport system fused ATPase/permease subunit